MPWEIEDAFRAKLGGNSFVHVPDLVNYKGESLIKVERRDDGTLGISFKVYDEKGNKLVTIGRNSLYMNTKYKGPRTFSLEGGEKDWKLIDKETKEIVVGISRKDAAKNTEIEIFANLYTPDGKFLIKATPESIQIGGIKFSNNIVMGSRTGFLIDENGSIGFG